MALHETKHLTSVDAAVARILQTTGSRIVLAIPLGLGKPNALVNALYQRVKADSTLELEILTALTLERPLPKHGLEGRLANPILARLFGDYVDLDYALDQRNGNLPANVRVLEFFFNPGTRVGNAPAQRDYISSNYTHAARDLLARGVNVVAQLVAQRADAAGTQYSLACNPEMTLDILPAIAASRATDAPILFIGQVHHELAFFGNDAAMDAQQFDLIVDDPQAQQRLYAVPSPQVPDADYMIALHASALLRDGGTLQIGIGTLGDAIAWCTQLRQQHNTVYQQLLRDAGVFTRHGKLIKAIGGVQPFVTGLFGSSEMFVNGFWQLIKAGVLRRAVRTEMLDGNVRNCIAHGGFFLGPAAFYQALREMPEELRAQINMTSIHYVNTLAGKEALKCEQRHDARFLNTMFMATLLGDGVSDALANGQVVSGVGGQYNFVAQAHELAGARSILMLRATRNKEGKITSNIVFNYGHITIPRHLRDMVITEYGIADLRGKTDGEVIEAMLCIADSRFQHELQMQAQAAGKLAHDYVIPTGFTENFPERQQPVCNAYRQHLPSFPFGSDLTDEEQVLAAALHQLSAALPHPMSMLRLLLTGFIAPADAHHTLLQRMQLTQPAAWRERVWRWLLLGVLQTSKDH